MQANMPVEKFVKAAFDKAVKEGAVEVRSISLIHRAWSKDQILEHAAEIALHKYLAMAEKSGLPPMFQSIKVMFKQRLKTAIEGAVQ